MAILNNNKCTSKHKEIKREKETKGNKRVNYCHKCGIPP